jgi:hypothetical protein
MQVSTFFQKTRTMKSPVTAFHLYRSVVEITTDYGDGKQQAHPRYLVDQTIYLIKAGQTTRMMAKMKNLSLSGAYLESTESPFPLTTAERIKLTIPVEGSKEYSFDCHVVWVKKIEGSRTGYGISFITDGIGGSETLENFFKGL